MGWLTRLDNCCPAHRIVSVICPERNTAGSAHNIRWWFTNFRTYFIISRSDLTLVYSSTATVCTVYVFTSSKNLQIFPGYFRFPVRFGAETWSGIVLGGSEPSVRISRKSGKAMGSPAVPKSGDSFEGERSCRWAFGKELGRWNYVQLLSQSPLVKRRSISV